MFFNIYNVFNFIFKFSLNFLFVLKYFTPFLYSNLTSYTKGNSNNLRNNTKANSNHLTLYSKIVKFNNFFSLILSTNSSLEKSLLNWFIFKKIINNNNSTSLKINEIVFIYIYLNLLYVKYFNSHLLSDKGFFNFQRINQTVKILNVLERRESNNKRGTTVLSNNFKKLSSYPQINLITTTFTNKIVSIKNNFSNWTIKFNSSSIDKLLSPLYNYNLLFIRNFKVFNKGRYSRNRQYYRTGVYWCLYINIIAVVGMYYWFYRFTMNFGYLWWLFYSFFFSFVASRYIKYNLFSYNSLRHEISSLLNWVGVFFEGLYFYFIKLALNRILNLVYKSNILNISTYKFFSKINSFLLTFYLTVYNIIF